MAGGRPAPEDIGATRESVIGSFSSTAEISPLPTSASPDANEPGMGLAFGHATSFTSSLERRVPIGSARAATATY